VFTGIIEIAAEVAAVEATATGGRMALRGVPFAGELAVGESVAVNGCCLTVTGAEPQRDGGTVRFDLLAETLRVTNLGRLGTGSLVNLERALRAGDRLSGHYVQGHVDTVVEVIDFSPCGQDHRFEVALPAAFSSHVIPRGSIALDGISLTVAEITPASVVCWIIPHTALVTNLRARRRGDLVNVEYDLIGKYVARWREASTGPVS
jgi:riboflavin synthase